MTDKKVDYIGIPTPTTPSVELSSAKVLHGKLIPPHQQVILYEPSEWELFILEWAHYQKTSYRQVVRFSGANDLGVDVAGFVESTGLNGVWDNYQCKHYKDALAPSIAIKEVGKIIWHIFKRHITCPRKYYFMAPRDCGMALKKLLLDSSALKSKVLLEWDNWCSSSITSKETILLEGDFKSFVNDFKFQIFTFKTTLEVIDEHRKTPSFAVRFGGGLPDRPKVKEPPRDPQTKESRYIQQLFDAYSDNKKENILNLSTLNKWEPLASHYHRQREYFYYAEALRNFARDSVPDGSFEDLQNEVYAGVVDKELSPHPCALTKLNSITSAAAQLPLSASILITKTKTQDKMGICHQLANEDRLNWKKDE